MVPPPPCLRLEPVPAIDFAPSRQKRAFRLPKFWNFTVDRFLFFPKSKNGRWGRCARNARTLVRKDATIGSSPFFEGDIFITEAFEFSFQVFIRHGFQL